jgi:hypothetical protein
VHSCRNGARLCMTVDLPSPTAWSYLGSLKRPGGLPDAAFSLLDQCIAREHLANTANKDQHGNGPHREKWARSPHFGGCSRH